PPPKRTARARAATPSWPATCRRSTSAASAAAGWIGSASATATTNAATTGATRIREGSTDMNAKTYAAATAALLLAACSAPAPGARSPARATREVAAAAVVAAVRAVGEHGHELEVQPLRDPQVEDLRAQASELEAAGKAKAATAVIDQALAITPEDPD